MSMTPDEFLNALLSLPRLYGGSVSPDGKWAAWMWLGTSAAMDVYFAPTDGSSAPIQRLSRDRFTFHRAEGRRPLPLKGDGLDRIAFRTCVHDSFPGAASRGASTATNKLRYVANRQGSAHHSVRPSAWNRFSERRARCDAPYQVAEVDCHRARSAACRPGRSARWRS